MNSIVLPDEIISKILTYNTHPVADIIRHRFKDDVPWVSKFVGMRYFGFIPLNSCGSNGRKIHIDYEEYYENYEQEDDDDEDEEIRLMMNCNCITRGGRQNCINDFNCNICGVCLYWKGYEEGTTDCGYC